MSEHQTIDKSYVKVLLKQGVSKGSSMGYEIECKMCEGTTQDELDDLGEKALASVFKLFKQTLSQKTI